MRFLRRNRQPLTDRVPGLEIERDAAVAGIDLDAFDSRALVDTAMPFDDAVGLRVDAGLAYVGRALRQIEAAGFARFAHSVHASPMHKTHCGDQRSQKRRRVSQRMLYRRAEQEDLFDELGFAARQLARIDPA